jgi:hypothetical protein
MFWECGKLSACEQFPTGDHRGIFYKGASIKQKFAMISSPSHSKTPTSVSSTLNIWDEIATRYTQGFLTYPTDKLVAIGGVAAVIASSLKCQYLAGLWRSELTKQLLWSVIGTGQLSSLYIAPTWSWASIAGPAANIFAARSATAFHSYADDNSDLQHMNVRGKITDLIEVVDTKEETIADDPFGQVKDGLLKVKGKLVIGRLNHDPEDYYNMHILIGENETESDICIRVTWDHRSCIETLDKNQNWHLLPILHYLSPRGSRIIVQGIVLKHTGQIGGEYRRCGHFLFHEDKESHYQRTMEQARIAFNESGEGDKLEFTDDGNGGRDYTIVII